MRKFAYCLKANSLDPDKYTPGECYEIVEESGLITMRRNDNGQFFSGARCRFLILPEGFDMNSKMGKLLRN